MHQDAPVRIDNFEIIEYDFNANYIALSTARWKYLSRVQLAVPPERLDVLAHSLWQITGQGNIEAEAFRESW